MAMEADHGKEVRPGSGGKRTMGRIVHVNSGDVDLVGHLIHHVIVVVAPFRSQIDGGDGWCWRWGRWAVWKQFDCM